MPTKITRAALLLLCSAAAAQSPYKWTRSLPIDFQSPTIGELGGTETRALVAFDGRLFAAMGYWRDTQQDNPKLPGAQVIVLDAPDAKWRIDLNLDQVIPPGNGAGLRAGRRKYQAIGDLAAFTAHQDATGKSLPKPVPFLLASVWDRMGGLRLFVRGAGAKPVWSYTDLATGVPPGSQIRSFGTHVDSVTHREIFFAGANPGGVYSGTFTGDAKFVKWSPQPEQWEGAATGIVGQKPNSRIMGFAECNGKFYASSGFDLFERIDGPSPTWKKIFSYDTPSDNPQVSGFRGMRAIPAKGGGEELLISVEASPFKIIRIDPRKSTPSATVDLNISDFLTKTWGTPVRYGIAAYNDMGVARLPGTRCDSLLIGFQATTPQDAKGVGGNRKRPSANYLVRRCDAPGYAMYTIEDPAHPGLPLVSTRTIVSSPFPNDAAIYAGGLDAGNLTPHNTAWIYRGVPTH